MSQVHDNIISSYHVDFDTEQLVLKTRYYYSGELQEHTDIVFSGYLVHVFKHALKGSVILDIEECDPIFFYEREREHIQYSRNYAWPFLYKTNDTKAELLAYIQENGYTVFEVSASYGLSGFVLAKEMEYRVLPALP